MSGSIPFAAIRDAALSQADRLLREWLPNGVVVGREFKVGNLAGDAGELVDLIHAHWRRAVRGRYKEDFDSPALKTPTAPQRAPQGLAEARG